VSSCPSRAVRTTDRKPLIGSLNPEIVQGSLQSAIEYSSPGTSGTVKDTWSSNDCPSYRSIEKVPTRIAPSGMGLPSVTEDPFGTTYA